jgi:hypothetical protein
MRDKVAGPPVNKFVSPQASEQRGRNSTFHVADVALRMAVQCLFSDLVDVQTSFDAGAASSEVTPCSSTYHTRSSAALQEIIHPGTFFLTHQSRILQVEKPRDDQQARPGFLQLPCKGRPVYVCTSMPRIRPDMWVESGQPKTKLTHIFHFRMYFKICTEYSVKDLAS